MKYLDFKVGKNHLNQFTVFTKYSEYLVTFHKDKGTAIYHILDNNGHGILIKEYKDEKFLQAINFLFKKEFELYLK